MAEKQSGKQKEVIDRTQLSTQLSNAIAMRSGVDAIFWGSFGTFWTTNAVLFVALFTASSGEPGKFVFSSKTSVWLTVAVAFAQVIVWAIVQRRVLAHLERTEALINRIEEKLEYGELFSISLRIAETDYQQFINRGLSTRQAVRISIWGVAAIWTIVGVLAWHGGL